MDWKLTWYKYIMQRLFVTYIKEDKYAFPLLKRFCIYFQQNIPAVVSRCMNAEEIAYKHY